MDDDFAPQPTTPQEHTDRRSASPTWPGQLLRWLATLNPGRTPREYEKATRYFFETPGVPDALEELTFDLLLAYRGALALRATPHHQQPRRRPPVASSLFVSGPTSTPVITSGERDAGGDEDGAGPTAEHEGRDNSGPLAPATVNIRLTALRQFLCYCALNGSLPQLSPDRIRGALRRLSIERRRPYQVLAEAEWEQFLMAARSPATHDSDGPTLQAPTRDAATNPAERQRGPWGLTRAERASLATLTENQETTGAHTGVDRPERSHTRLTGRRTGQRDHALIALALATGLRAIELTSLDVGDLRRERHDGQEEWWLVLPDEKTKGQHGGRTLPLAPALMETLLAYIRATSRRWEDARDRATPLFLSTHGRSNSSAAGESSARSDDVRLRRLSPSHVRLIVDRVETQWRQAREAQGEGGLAAGEGRAISPHALRHSTAVALLEGNEAQGRPPASVEHVRGWLGHFDIRTTQGYLAHLDARRHRRPFTLAPVSSPQQAPSEADTPAAHTDE